jgi:hypothetical protein
VESYRSAQGAAGRDWARDHVFERTAVQDRRVILETALVRGMGETTYARIRQEFERRIETGEWAFATFNLLGIARLRLHQNPQPLWLQAFRK